MTLFNKEYAFEMKMKDPAELSIREQQLEIHLDIRQQCNRNRKQLLKQRQGAFASLHRTDRPNVVFH